MCSLYELVDLFLKEQNGAFCFGSLGEFVVALVHEGVDFAVHGLEDFLEVLADFLFVAFSLDLLVDLCVEQEHSFE